MALQALRCIPVVSHWVDQVIQMCDGRLALLFRNGACCYYPATDVRYFELALVWFSKGKFVWEFLGRIPHRIQAYRLIPLPCPPAGCQTSTTIQSSANPSNPGDAVTFTATVTNPLGGLVPQGTVEFFDGSTDLGPGTALAGSGASATSTFTSGGLASGGHTITAVFTGSGGWLTSQASLTQTVGGSVSTTCCGNALPTTLYATLGNGGGCACASGTTIPLTWDGISKWTGTGATGCGHNITLNLSCPSGSTCTGFTLTYSYPDSCHASGTAVTKGGCTCNPLSLPYISIQMTGCGCTGTIQATITT
jgi:hypothetical protein